MAEKHKDKIILHNMDSYAVQLLIEYSYTGDVTITGDNVQVSFKKYLNFSRYFSRINFKLLDESFYFFS